MLSHHLRNNVDSDLMESIMLSLFKKNIRTILNKKY